MFLIVRLLPGAQKTTQWKTPGSTPCLFWVRGSRAEKSGDSYLAGKGSDIEDNSGTVWRERKRLVGSRQWVYRGKEGELKEKRS